MAQTPQMESIGADLLQVRRPNNYRLRRLWHAGNWAITGPRYPGGGKGSGQR